MLPLLYREPPSILKGVSEKLKFLYFLTLLILVLLSRTIYFPLVVFFSHLLILLFIFSLRPKTLFKLYLEPLLIALLIPLIKSLSLFPLVIKPELALKGTLYSFKILSAFSLFLIFYFSTNFFDTLRILQWLRVPVLLRELIFLTFQFLLIIHNKVLLTYLSQKTRLGYSNSKNSLRSFYYLIQSTFLNSLKHTETLLQSMQQRGYDFNHFPLTNSSLSLKSLLIFLVIILFWFGVWKTISGWM